MAATSRRRFHSGDRLARTSPDRDGRTHVTTLGEPVVIALVGQAVIGLAELTVITLPELRHQYPLPDAYFREKLVYPTLRTLRHPATATARAKSPPFARKRHQSVKIARPALQPTKTGFDITTGQISVEFLMDKTRKVLFFLR